jgi:hypothetical protein
MSPLHIDSPSRSNMALQAERKAMHELNLQANQARRALSGGSTRQPVHATVSLRRAVQQA